MRASSFIMVVMLLSISLTLRSQEYSREFGSKIGQAEAALSVYAPDRSAEAVVLFDKGESYFEQSDRGFDVIFKKETRIKILNDAGIKWAEIEIPFYQEGNIYEKIFDIEAFTYNPSGTGFTRTPFNTGNTHDEKVNEYWLVKKFALPDVKAGSIIEYRYKIRSQDKFNLRDWNFQNFIPTVYSEYVVRTIPFYNYNWFLQGTNKFDINTSRESTGMKSSFVGIEFNEMVNTYVMKSVPAFKDEEYITSVNDHIIKIDFQLAAVTQTTGQKTNILSTWPEMVKTLLKDEDVTKFANKCEKLSARLLSPDSLKNKSASAKFDYILDYVKANFSWNKKNGKYASKSPNDLLKDKVGNAADLNLLAIGLLNASGIEAYPVIISTRDHGKIKFDFPLPGAFNYVLVDALIDGKNVLSDVTHINCPNNMIPSNCLNDKGLVIKEGDVVWLPLTCNLLSEIQTNFLIDSIGPVFLARTNIKATDYEALRYRNTYGNDKAKIAERVNENDYKVDEQSIIINDPDKELPFVLDFNTTKATEIISNRIFLSPFLNESMTDNPLKQDTRTYPVDMLYPVKRSYNSKIAIPDNYKVDFVPANYKILNELFELNYNVQTDNKTINISFDYTFKKSLYQPKDYSSLKFYFREIIKKGNEKVVLSQIS